MPTKAAIEIIKNFTKSPSRMKEYSDEYVWKSFPVEGRTMLVQTIREVLRQEQFEGMSNWDIHQHGRQATYTRRTNKVSSYISAALSRVARRGGSGIYQLSFSWYSHENKPMAFVYSNSVSEASTIFETMYKPIIQQDRDWHRVEIKFIDFTNQAEALTKLNDLKTYYNQQSSRLKQKRESLERSIVEINDKMEHVETIRSFSNQLLIMTLED